MYEFYLKILFKQKVKRGKKAKPVIIKPKYKPSLQFNMFVYDF